MFVQADGQVQIRRRDTQTTARLADFLYSGDRVIVGLGRARFLFCPSGETIAVRDDSTVEVRAKSVEVVKGVPLFRQKEDRCPILRLELGSETIERIGGLRGRGAPIPLYLGGKVSVSRPTFRWGTIAGAKTYLISLRDHAGTVLWEEITPAASVSYPPSKPALPAASYEWEVVAQDGARTLAQQSTSFEVKPFDVLKRGSDEPSLLFEAAELETAGYYAEAAATFRSIRTAHPEDERFTHHLAWLYWNAGLVSAADEEIKLLNAQGLK
jgi:hypothetical protein